MKEEKKDDGEIGEELEKPYGFWICSIASVIFRFFLILFRENINLSSRPEVSTPLTSLRRRTASISLSLTLIISPPCLQFRLQFSVCFECSVAEGYWLKQSSMSPYAGFGIVSYIWNLRILRLWKLRIVFVSSEQDLCIMALHCCSPFLVHSQFKGSDCNLFQI